MNSLRASLSKLSLHLAHAVDVYNRVRLHDALPGDLSPRGFAAAYAGGGHREYVVEVKAWRHDPYAPQPTGWHLPPLAKPTMS